MSTSGVPQERDVPILIVEGDPLLGTEISNVLERLGFTVSGIASTAHEAMCIAEVEKPALALIDARLSGPVAGEQLAKSLRDLGIAILFLMDRPEATVTGFADAEDMVSDTESFRPSAVFKKISAILANPSHDGFGQKETAQAVLRSA
jgi:DNA-binding response OmpR family regulator